MDDFIEFIKQWDDRYRDVDAEKHVRKFIECGAVLITHATFKFGNEPDIRGIKAPQRDLKYYTKQIFLEYGVDFVGFERRVHKGIVDVLGRCHNKDILVECGPCRVDKIIHYLRNDSVELWLVNGEFSLSKTCTVHLHRILRGSSWNVYYHAFATQLQKRLKNVKSPLESI